MNIRAYLSAVLFWSFVLALPISAYSSPVTLEEGLQSIEIWPDSLVATVAPEQDKGPSHVQHKLKPWQKEEFPFFGFTDNVVYIKFDILNSSSQAKHILTLSHVHLDKITLYKKNLTDFDEVAKAGLSVPMAQSDSNSESYEYAFDLNIEPGHSAEYMMRVEAKFPLILPLRVETVDHFRSTQKMLDKTFWFYLGVIFLLLFYNLAIFLRTGLLEYLYYIMAVASLHIFANLSQYGVFRSLFFPDAIWLHSNVFYLTHPAALITSFLFFDRFAGVSDKLPYSSRFLKMNLVVAVVAGAWGIVFGGDTPGLLLEINAVAMALVTLVSTYRLAYRGERQAIFFSMAWSFLIISWIIGILRLNGVLPTTYFTKYAILFGSVLEGIFLFIALADRLKRSQKDRDVAKRKAVEHAARWKLARKVAHDIRSPLMALEFATNDLKALAEPQRILIRNASERIRDIANDLLQTDREQLTSQSEKESLCLMGSLVEGIVSEKRIQYIQRESLDIFMHIQPRSYGCFTLVQQNNLKRALSNLIDNAAEAISDKGTIAVKLRSSGEKVYIRIEDTGKGIPRNILDRLGKEPISFGKQNKSSGSGLGFISAKESIEEMGGVLRVTSKEGRGTTIEIKLCSVEKPAWFAEELQLNQNTQVVVVEDEKSARLMWQNRLQNLNLLKEPLFFSSPEELSNWISAKPSSNDILFLVDQNLDSALACGSQLIKRHQICQSAVLVTSEYEDTSLIDFCEKWGVQILPKPWVNHVPVLCQKTTEYPGLCNT